MPVKCRHRVVAVLATLAAPAVVAAPAQAATCASQGLSATPLQSKVFYIDAATDYLGSYVGYRIENTGSTTRSALWFRLESFTGNLQPADGNAATAPLPLTPLADGASTPAYAYLKAPAATTVAQSHDVVVYDGRPGSGGAEVCRDAQTITAVADVIKAAANKVTGASRSGDATLGGTFSITVTGETGTIGSGPTNDPGIVRFSPAVAAAWPSSAFRLVSVSHELPTPGTIFSDVLSRSDLAFGNTPYTVSYTFRVVGPTRTATPLVPVQNIASGTQVKHTDPGTLQALAPIPVVTSSATVVVDTPVTGPYTSGQSVPLTATVQNDGATPIAIDELIATIPAGWAVESSTSTFGGARLPEPHVEGGTVRFVGPFTVPAGTSSTLEFAATAGAAGTSGSYTATGRLAGGQIDATTDVGDDTPSTRTLTVLGRPTAEDDAFVVTRGRTVDWDVLADDTVAGGTPTITITRAPGAGRASVVDGRVRYVADALHTGLVTLEYTLTTRGGSDAAEVSISVVDPPPAPAPGPETSTGVGTAPQQVTLPVPTDGTVRLVDDHGERVTSWIRPGIGSFELDPASGVLTFTPVSGYVGEPEVTFELTDAHGQTGTGTYTATVTPPAGPTAAPESSTGIGGATHITALVVPAGGTATLLLGSAPVASLSDGTGTYSVADGTVTYVPARGFSGTATSVPYRLTDAYGQSDESTYTPTVTLPPGPTATAKSSTGVAPASQGADLDLPSEGSVSLLTALGLPATTVSVPGQGTYTLATATGRVTFTPVPGFHGTPTPVAYEVTDVYGQTARSTYSPVLSAPGGPTAAARTSTGVGTAPQSTVVPPADAIVLRDGSRSVDGIVVPGQGAYVLDAATRTITFAPQLGFAGVATPVTYRVTDAFGQVAEATYTPTVLAPAGPPAPDRTSSGTGTERQERSVPVPLGGRATLIDGEGREATSFVTGDGEYTLDPVSGVITFAPRHGYAGTAAVRYAVVDAYGQRSEGTFTPTVLAPPAPDAAPQQSFGKPGETQERALTVPTDGRVALLDAEGRETSVVRIPGQGEYRLSTSPAVVSFVPDPGFTGLPTLVRYRVSDAYGQVREASYQPEVEAVADSRPTSVAATCASRRTMTIHWWVARATALRSVTVTINGERVARLPGRARVATVPLSGRPKQTVRVAVTGRTARGGTVSTTRTYRTCAGKLASTPLPTLRLRPKGV